MAGKRIKDRIEALQAELSEVQGEGKPVILFLATKLLEELEAQGYEIDAKSTSGLNSVFIWEHNDEDGSRLDVQAQTKHVRGQRYKKEEGHGK